MASRTALTILALILLIAAREGRAEAYPSTYEPLPSEPLLITNATVLTGTGERIDGGSLLLQDGRIADWAVFNLGERLLGLPRDPLIS